MKAFALLLFSFPFFAFANPISTQVIEPSENKVFDFDFGKVPVGKVYYTLFTLTAPKDRDLNISQIVVGGDMYAAFTECTEVLKAGTTCDTEVDFAPTSEGVHKGQLGIATDLGNIIVNLSGEGVTATSKYEKHMPRF